MSNISFVTSHSCGNGSGPTEMEVGHIKSSKEIRLSVDGDDYYLLISEAKKLIDYLNKAIIRLEE